MLKFFIVNYKGLARLDFEKAATMSVELIKEIASYFGNDENNFSIAPRSIVLEQKFEEYSKNDIT